jgi:YYY domain-containing protein
LLGPLFVVLVGNLEGALDSLHSLHLLWGAGPNGQLASRFWSWLDIVDLSSAPVGNPSVIPGRFLWWWRASRVVHDATLAGAKIEVIDEFPFFSFLLADNHPHLLALPFVLLAVGFALQVFSAGRREEKRMTTRPVPGGWVRGFWLAAGGVAALVIVARLATSLAAGSTPGTAILAGLRIGVLVAAAVAVLGAFLAVLFGLFPISLDRREFWFAAWLFGSLAFLNTWDWPIYLSLLLAAAWWCSRSSAWQAGFLRMLATGGGLVLAGAILYLPWFPSFKSQAGGVLPNLAFPTRFPQFLTMFGTAFVPILIWLIWRARRQWKKGDTVWLIGIGLGAPLALLLLSWLLGGLLAAVDPSTVDAAVSGLGAATTSQALDAIASRRLGSSWTALALGLTVALCAVLLRTWARRPDPVEGDEDPDRQGWPFAVLLIGIGALLVLGPEFLYLKDGFGSRMNTVFKFYFAAWVLWGVAAAFIATELWPRRPSIGGALRSLALVPLLLGLVYPTLSLQTKTDGFNPPGGRTLDGAAHLASDAPADYAAILWLDEHVRVGVLAEAIGGSYSGYGRISTHTGLPTVLGWDFHEWQWRGSWTEQGSRKADIERLYTTRDSAVAQQIVDQYGITLVYIGPLERQTYRPLSESKFSAFMTEVYRTDEVVIFALRGAGVS